MLIKDQAMSIQLFGVKSAQVNQLLDQIAIAAVVLILALIWVGLMWKLANFVFHKFIIKVIKRKWR